MKWFQKQVHPANQRFQVPWQCGSAPVPHSGQRRDRAIQHSQTMVGRKRHNQCARIRHNLPKQVYRFNAAQPHLERAARQFILFDRRQVAECVASNCVRSAKGKVFLFQSGNYIGQDPIESTVEFWVEALRLSQRTTINVLLFCDQENKNLSKEVTRRVPHRADRWK